MGKKKKNKENTPSDLKISFLFFLSFLQMSGQGTKEEVMRKTLKMTVEWLRKERGDDESGWKWGDLHSITFRHFLGSASPLDQVFNIGPFRWDGDCDTVKMSSIIPGTFRGNGWNPTFRQLIDMADMDGAIVGHAPGQSGMIGSPYYDSMLEDWKGASLHLIRKPTQNDETLHLLPK
jgi:penicillin amidase